MQDPINTQANLGCRGVEMARPKSRFTVKLSSILGLRSGNRANIKE